MGIVIRLSNNPIMQGYDDLPTKYLKMKNINLYLIVCFLFVTKYTQAQQIEIPKLKKHIYYLADDKMKGRGTGSKEKYSKQQTISKKNSKNINYNPKVNMVTVSLSKPKYGK
jgi:hypothetical protein